MRLTKEQKIRLVLGSLEEEGEVFRVEHVQLECVIKAFGPGLI